MLSISEIWQEDPVTLAITWQDNQTDYLNTGTLRKACPCAICLAKLQNGGSVDSLDHVPTPLWIESVGGYGLSIKFSDGHTTGIYSFKYLKSLS